VSGLTPRTRAYCANVSDSNLWRYTIGCVILALLRMLHFVRAKNLPYSTNEVKKICTSCHTFAELKLRLYSSQESKLVNVTQPFERLSIDFKGPFPTSFRKKYLLTVIDEFPRFSFAFPDMQSTTVVRCLDQLFSLCGMPGYIRSDN